MPSLIGGMGDLRSCGMWHLYYGLLGSSSLNTDQTQALCSGSQNFHGSQRTTTKVSDSLTSVTQTHMRDTIKNQPNYCILLGP